MSFHSRQSKIARRLVKLNDQAIRALNGGRYDEAIQCLNLILMDEPNFDHGAVMLLLGDAFQGKGDFNQARQHYERALSKQPENSSWAGKYASFLYLHGKAIEAFEAYLRLARLDGLAKDAQGLAKSLEVLARIGSKAGWSRGEVWQRVCEIVSHEDQETRELTVDTMRQLGWSQEDTSL